MWYDVDWGLQQVVWMSVQGIAVFDAGGRDRERMSAKVEGDGQICTSVECGCARCGEGDGE